MHLDVTAVLVDHDQCCAAYTWSATDVCMHSLPHLVACAWQQVWDAVLLHLARAGVLRQPGCMCGGRCQIQQLHFMRGDVSMHTVMVVCVPSKGQLGPARQQSPACLY